MRWGSHATSRAGCASSRKPRRPSCSPAPRTSAPSGSCAASWTRAASEPARGRAVCQWLVFVPVGGQKCAPVLVLAPRVAAKGSCGFPACGRGMDDGAAAAGGFLAHRALIAFAAGAAMAEAGLLIAFAPAARALAPQVTAVPPLAVFHDLRWLYGAQRSWLEFTLLLAGLILARSGVNSVLVRLAWPTTEPAPTPMMAWRSALGFTVVACLLMSPVASLTLGVAILPFSWPFLGTLPVLLLIALPISHGGMTSAWWRMLPPPSAAGWLLTDFALLSVAAAVTGRLPVAAAVPVAGLAGLVNARAWYGLTAVVARAHAISHGQWLGVHRIPSVPVATIVTMAVVVLAIRLAFVVGIPAEHAPQPGPEQASAAAGSTTAAQRAGDGPGGPGGSGLGRWSRRPPVLVVPGFGSLCCGHGQALAQAMPDTLVQTFSYEGLDQAGNPLPYGPAASDLPLPVLGDRIAAQVRRLQARTGQPVNVVAESEGTLGVYAMLARHPGVPVAAVTLLSPIVAPGQVTYPVDGGSARVPGEELQGVVWFVGGLSPFGTSGAQTLIGSVNQVGARFAAEAARHHQLRWMALVPLADAVTLPTCAEIVAAAASAWRIPLATPPSPPCPR